MQNLKKIGSYIVSAESETFRIYPKNKKGESIPVTRVNNFIYLRDAGSSKLVVFKRYLHCKQWYWRDSRELKPVHEADVVSEIARMLFGGSQALAVDFIIQAITGGL